jgi:tetratricopeptide (TPR) repeat protein
MNDSSKAIFLSYASQDAEAARRIHDVLHSAGLEVWFDRSELRGGDAWDASIRRQIRECALFVPIVSANTQSRTEGYFRLEWRLAEQRSHLMAKGRPFLVPVVIDATAEAGAHVPDAFLDVQWTRLPGGDCGPPFADRVKQLLAGAMPAPHREPVTSQVASAPPMPDSTPSRFSRRRASIVAIAVLAVVVPFAVKWARDSSTRSSALAAEPGSDVAGDRVAKARELLDDDPLRTRRNVELAEQFALEAIAKDPTSAEAFAAASWANYRFISANYEDTPKRRADLRSYAEKATLLDPDSINADLAYCGLLEVNSDWAEAGRCLSDLMQRAPDNLTVLREAAWTSIHTPPDAQAAQPVEERTSGILDRMRATSPLGRSHADMLLAAVHWRRGEYVEADRLLDGVFASGQPVRESYLLRLLVLLYGWGDLDAAREFAATIPPKLLLEDVFIYHVATLWMQSGDYEKALETLNRSQRDMLQEALVEYPTAAFRGDAHAAAGRRAAAELQWREAIKTLDRLLETEPDRASLHEQKANVLASLGQREDAAAEYTLSQELSGNPAAGTIQWALSGDYYIAAGDYESAIVRMDRLLQLDYGRWPSLYNHLRYSPSTRPLHDDPRVKAMLERGARWLAEKRKGVDVPETAPPSAPTSGA